MCSFFKQGKKKQGIFHVHFTLQHMYVHDSKLDERNREIALFLSQAEQKGIRIFSCSFYFTTDVCCGFQIARKEKRNFTLFLSQAEQKGKGIFSCSFYFTTYVCSRFQIGRKEQRNCLVPFSSRTEREKEFFMLISLYNMCIFIITGRMKRT